MSPIRTLVLACGFLVAAGGSWAQGGAASGVEPAASAPGPGAGARLGPGMHGGRGRGARAGAQYTAGWAMMTPAERSEHIARMRSMTTQGECRDYVQKHHDEMAARAKERGGKPLAQPRRDPCAGLKP